MLDIYLLYKKSQSLNVFKNFKTEVENQLSKRNKSIRSNRSVNYYGKYNSSCKQCLWLFTRFLEECGVIPQYTTLGSPIMNDVVEKWNIRLKDMMKSLVCHFTLTELLWKVALNITAYILNRILNKKTAKILYELWISKRPSLKYLIFRDSS